jgi:hypothetical protein
MAVPTLVVSERTGHMPWRGSYGAAGESQRWELYMSIMWEDCPNHSYERRKETGIDWVLEETIFNVLLYAQMLMASLCAPCRP